MSRSKANKDGPRKVWRMSTARPNGEFVVPLATRPEDAGPAAAHERGLMLSSLELLFGTEVSETPMDTLPGELIDAFTKPGPAGGA